MVQSAKGELCGKFQGGQITLIITNNDSMIITPWRIRNLKSRDEN